MGYVSKDIKNIVKEILEEKKVDFSFNDLDDVLTSFKG